MHIENEYKTKMKEYLEYLTQKVNKQEKQLNNIHKKFTVIGFLTAISGVASLLVLPMPFSMLIGLIATVLGLYIMS